jgi:hypothetical protein
MAKETVTQSARFYCVSLTPDICKTPVGNSTPPIPYNIIGEYKEAEAVSRNVKSQSDLLFLHGKSYIPKVKGDEPGTAGGIKSGTNKDKAESQESSSTFWSNVDKTIQEGRKVYMNAKNTVGRNFERGVQAAREALTPIAQKYLDNISQTGHEIADDAMDKGGKVMAGGATIFGGGALVSATGVGAPVGVPTMAVGKVGVVAGGLTSTAGAAGKTALNILDNIANSIVSGQLPTAGQVGEVLADAAINQVAGKLPGGRAVAGKAKGAKSELKGNDGGKQQKPKDEKKDKPDDCCPKNGAPGGKSTTSKKPIHFGTGEKILTEVDFVIEGPYPFTWSRTYRSGSELGDWGPLGARWATPYTSSLFVCKQGIVFHDSTGRGLRLPNLEIGQQHDQKSDGFILRRDSASQFTLTWRDGSSDIYHQGQSSWLPHGYQGINAMLEARSPIGAQRYYLNASTTLDGKTTQISFNPQAQAGEVLLRILTVDGHVLEALCDVQPEPLPSNAQQQSQEEPHEPAQQLSIAPVAPRIACIDQVFEDGRRVRHVSYSYAAEVDPEQAALDEDATTPLPQEIQEAAQTLTAKQATTVRAD